MTEEQLIRNIAKSNSQSSNYYKLVKMHAYYDMKFHNSFVKYTNAYIKELRETDKRMPRHYIETGPYRIYNNKGKLICFTKYTKYLRFRTYRQQLAITANKLEKSFREHLKLKDTIRRDDHLHNWKSSTYVSEFPNFHNVVGFKTRYILVSR